MDDPGPAPHLGSPIAAFERAVREALEGPPCVVLFSGGRDSSAVLAVAMRLARHHGLDPPLPVSVRMASDPEAHEDTWQELVIRHLDVPEWDRVTVVDELDLVGPAAQAVLRRHGLLWPPYFSLHRMGIERAAAGTLLIGLHGDGVLLENEPRRRLRRVAAFQSAPTRRDLLRLGLAVSPRPIRKKVLAHRPHPEPPTWLTPEARAEVRRREVDLDASNRLSWARNVRLVPRRRTFALAMRGLSLLAADHDCRVLDPFGDRGFVEALARHYGWRGPDGRTAAMRDLFAADLPEEVVTRPDKARFRHAYFGPYTAEFARTWDGTGLPDLVDPERFRAALLQITDRAAPLPHGANGLSLPLQAAWLAAHTAEDSQSQS